MKNKSIYIYELILFAFIAIFKIFFNDRFSQFEEITIILFFGASLIVLYQVLGRKKNKSLLTDNAIQLSIIVTMLFFLLSYLSGLILGFLKNSYSISVLSVLKNITCFSVMIISEEIIREMVAKRCNVKKLPLVILTIAYILFDLVLVFNVNSVNTNLKIFVFVCNTVLPIIARNLLCSYLAYNIGATPGIIYRLAMTLYPYILPIVPDLGYYISSVFGILVPYIIYILISKLIKDSEKIKLSPIKKNLWYINIPLIVMLLFIVSLVSGIFKYQIMAIGSGSMEPIIQVGDAVIFSKLKESEKMDADVGEVLVFMHNGKYITHRIVNKYVDSEGELVYQTKGDKNNDNDNFAVHKSDVVGVVKLKINYIGLPSIWVQNLFRN